MVLLEIYFLELKLAFLSSDFQKNGLKSYGKIGGQFGQDTVRKFGGLVVGAYYEKRFLVEMMQEKLKFLHSASQMTLFELKLASRGSDFQKMA